MHFQLSNNNIAIKRSWMQLFIVGLKRIYRIFGYSFEMKQTNVRFQTNIRLLLSNFIYSLYTSFLLTRRFILVSFSSMAKTKIPNNWIFVRFETDIFKNLYSIRVNIIYSYYFGKFLILLRKWWNFSHKIHY